MPFPWVPTPTAVVAPVAVSTQQTTGGIAAQVARPSLRVELVDGRLTASRQSSNQAVKESRNPTILVEADVSAYDLKRDVWKFDGHVVATYDVDRVEAEHLELHMAPSDMKGFASGNVVLNDPDGTLRARDLEFSWNPKLRYATARDILLKFEGAFLRAGTAYLTPSVWSFTDFTMTTDGGTHPIYVVSGRTIWIYPGRYARVYRPSLSLFGAHILTWPRQTFNLDPRATGLRLPNLEYRSGTVGLNWVAGTLVDHHSTVEWHGDAFRGSYPGAGIEYNRSFIPANQAVGLITPRTELNQRFDFGYFDTVLVKTPGAEIDAVDRPRNTVAVQTDFNAGVSGRGAPNETFSFPVEFNYERSGRVGSLGNLSDFRLETIRDVRQATKTRGEYESSWELPSKRLGRNVFTLSRVDGEAIGGDHAFGWARLSGGLVFQPVRWLTLSAGAMAAAETGTPDFDIDPLVYRNGAFGRADYELGPRRLSLMTRYDSRLGWFDDEVLFTQAMGTLEAYLVYRKYPSDLRYGVLLRINQIADVLKRRNFSRTSDASAGGGSSQ